MDILAEARDWDYNPGDLGLPYLPWFDCGQWGHHGYSRPIPWGRPDYFSWTGSFRPESEYVYAKGVAGNGEVIERMDFNPSTYTFGRISDTEYYTSDILGSTMMLTDKHGQVRERYEYDAFGSLYEGAFARLNAVGYTGKRYDAKSGRYDYSFREYSPSLGRFTTSDPIRSGANWYVYCMNEPVNFTDPFGLFDWKTGRVQPGDTLGDIVYEANQRAGSKVTSVSEVVKFNDISNPDLIHPGDYIGFPDPAFTSIYPEKFIIDWNYGDYPTAEELASVRPSIVDPDIRTRYQRGILSKRG